MKVGYARVSTRGQSLESQLDQLHKAGCVKVIQEKESGAKERKILEQELLHLREGDSFVVTKLDRLGRSLKDLLEKIDLMKQKGVTFISLNDSIDTSTPSGRLFLNIIGSLAEYEREMIIERTLAGLESAKKRGKVGGRKPGPTKRVLTLYPAIKTMYQSKNISIQDICKSLKISKGTVYKSLKDQQLV